MPTTSPGLASEHQSLYHALREIIDAWETGDLARAVRDADLLAQGIEESADEEWGEE